jgi:uncharacterized RDD family membrane protein YckC
VSDIPIGSPPVPPGRHAAPQGWYPDPVDQRRERYWDGWSWSRNTRESTQPYFPQDQFPQFPPHQPQHGHGGRPQGADRPGGVQQPPYRPYPPGREPQTSHQPAPAVTADGVPIAGWGWRLLAGVLDLIVVFVVADIVSIPILIRMLEPLREYFDAVVQAAQRGTGTPPTLSPTDLLSSGDQILVTVITLVVGLGYFSLFWRFKAATLAQLLCGLKIVPVDDGHNDQLLSWQVVVVRALTWWVPIAVSNVLLIFAAINVLFPLSNVKRQAIHDLAARTQVVKIK